MSAWLRRLLVLGTLTVSASAQATIMVPLSLADLTHEASAVVRAKVLARHADWDQAHQRIYTTTTLAVVDVLYAKQKLGSEIRVRTMGGEVGEVGMKVAGTPDLKVGEETLLFLRDDTSAGQFLVVGMNQGHFVVKTENGREIAVPTQEGIAYATPGVDGVVRVDPQHPTPGPTPYLDLKSRILQLKAEENAMSVPPAVPAVSPAPTTPRATQK